MRGGVVLCFYLSVGRCAKSGGEGDCGVEPLGNIEGRLELDSQKKGMF